MQCPKLLTPWSARVAATVLLLALPAATQTGTVSPRGFRPVSGGSSTGYPWGYGSINSHRYQQVHDDLAGNPRVILGIAVRRKEGGTIQWPAIGPELEVFFSTAATTSRTSTSTYATNHGTDLKTVIAKKIVNFPAVNAPGSLPAPFTYVMTFDTPFIYLGQGSVCYEIVCTNNNYTGGTLLSLDLAQDNVMKNQRFGDGCGGATLTGTYAAPNLQQTASGLPASTTAFLMIGYDNESLSGVPLPLDLSGLGAAGCSLFVAPLVFLPQASSAAGVATFSLDTSGAPADVMVQLQVLALAPSVNPMGLVFTNGLLASPRTPMAVMRNWNSNIALPTGNLQIGLGLVTLFMR
jgi:hypothetical protein